VKWKKGEEGLEVASGSCWTYLGPKYRPLSLLNINSFIKSFINICYENKPMGDLEEVLIDAVTGVVTAQQVMWYGVVR
jgi:hypothetical protein